MAKLARRTVWICTDGDSRVGLWYASRSEAFAKADAWQAIFPATLELPTGAPMPFAGEPDSGAEAEREAIQTEGT